MQGESLIFSGLKLPSKLSRAVNSVSTTVQVLIAEIIMHAEGLNDRDRSEAGKLDYAMRNQRATELLEKQLQDFLCSRKLKPEDAAIAMAASVGHSTREIADFFDMSQLYAMRRLCAIRKQAADYKRRRDRVKDIAQLCFAFFRSPEPTQDQTDVVEIFSEAQNR